ncbi:multifunctional transcriptional regulator/nicotinamide-nucleotide adenylyltransferase/ribosylnicotinamide kinase NadR [Klugiella xanthotipulae]|uniref:NadR type nicotinamide-nucleotide adenylyltransferase n=1 Tax=Klugiella xanthotipulae TaxID=244735 RepID=A0A543I682_9MICO|nr:AAA family ATPase [Klugiella xanthotipulae]TQM66087.1 NadR type nicotinamide-nucleotide adenylyltransferase [Klugiella xanthotipulae]
MTAQPYSRGLAIGKFYPPHNGHLALIERGAAESGRLAVLVMASQFESIPVGVRVDWLRGATAHLGNVDVLGIVSDAPVDYRSDIAWVANHASMVAALDRVGITRVDAVFSSEAYGTELAARFDATPISYDESRVQVPISGTAVRRDLPGTWPLLPEATRLGLATRVIVVGAESTGSTTLSEALLAHYRRRPGLAGMTAVEEYGRCFTYELHAQAAAEARASGHPVPGINNLVWQTEHFGRIATVQNEWEDAAALASPLVIADTDALATTLWERRYVGEHSRAATAVIDEYLPRRDVYLLTDHEGVPFEQDGWRDGEQIRPAMTRWFIEELTRRELPWVLLRGDHDTRLRYSIDLIDALWAKNIRFDSPPWASVTELGGVSR